MYIPNFKNDVIIFSYEKLSLVFYYNIANFLNFKET